MARVTVEDCVEIIPNRFELVISAAQRAKQISSGIPLTLDRDNDKDAVVALREVAEQTINLDHIREEVVQSFQKKTGIDPTDVLDEDMEMGGMIGMKKAEISEAFKEASQFIEEGEEQEPAAGFSFVEENVEAED